MYNSKELDDQLLCGIEVMSEKEYEDYLKSQESDISGMSRYDKYKMGLDESDGSDTDQDGLTDKEEIEVYHTDPLKQSTADDLYTDGYKVAHNMDLFTYYDYVDDITFANNECNEVKLSAKVPSDLYAVVQDITGSENVTGYQIYREYWLYNYSDRISIDISDILNANDIKLSDIDILIYDGIKVKKARWSKGYGNVIKIKKDFELYYDYNIYIVRKSSFGSINLLINNSAVVSPNNEIEGKGFVAGSFLFSVITKRPLCVYYEDLGDSTKSEQLRNDIVYYINDEIMGDDFMSPLDNVVKMKNGFEIDAIYSLLQVILPDFEFDERHLKWHQLLYCYFSYEDIMNNKENFQTDEAESFNIYEDELPFGNFGSYISNGGNCAGIAHITSTLYNTGTLPENGDYKVNTLGDIKWNIAIDEENRTLLNRGLYDYQTSDFAIEYQNEDGVIDYNRLNNAQKAFVDMVGCYWKEGNDKVNFNNYLKRKGISGYDYSLITKMMDSLDKGQILDVYFTLKGGGAHAVNIYGYYHDFHDPNIIWFKVYDNNIPQDKLENYKISNNGHCLLKVWKEQKLFGKGDTIGFDYYPIKEKGKYRATTKGIFGARYAFVILDNEWNIYNDVIK